MKILMLCFRFGRRPTMIATFTACLGCMFGVAFSGSTGMYIAFRAAAGGFNYGMSIATYVYSKY